MAFSSAVRLDCLTRSLYAETAYTASGICRNCVNRLPRRAPVRRGFRIMTAALKVAEELLLTFGSKRVVYFGMKDDLNSSLRDFRRALADTPVARHLLRVSYWFLKPKAINRTALVFLVALVTAYICGSIYLTFSAAQARRRRGPGCQVKCGPCAKPRLIGGQLRPPIGRHPQTGTRVTRADETR